MGQPGTPYRWTIGTGRVVAHRGVQVLEGGSRAISLHDYGSEKERIDAVPHKVITPNSRQRTNKPKKKLTSTRPGPSQRGVVLTVTRPAGGERNRHLRQPHFVTTIVGRAGRDHMYG